MYRIDRNNYHQNPKNSNIQTPKEVSKFIFNLLKDKIKKRSGDKPLILDPCCGQGSLLEPWNQKEWIDNPRYSLIKHSYLTYGIDTDEESKASLKKDFFQIKNWSHLALKEPSLILCNPPFNGYKGKLASEVWLDKIIELFGKEFPIVLFTPPGLCLNLTTKSLRHKKFVNGDYPPISSIIRLPKNIFPSVIFHSEILIFNIRGLEPHYFYHDPK